MSTSVVVGKDMSDWVLSHGGEKWTVKLDVRDLGLDTTFGSRSATLAARDRLVIPVVRTMFLPGALHVIETSLLAPLACVSCAPPSPRLSGLVVGLWPVLDPCLACQMVHRVVILRWIWFAEGCPGHSPIHLLTSSAADIGFRWDSVGLSLGCLP